MTTSVKLAAFAAVLVVVFLAGLVAGSAIGPIDTGSPAPAHGAP